MKVLVWIGLAMIVCWGILWLGVKMAVGAVHLLLLLGLVLVGWGLFSGLTHRSRTADRLK